ncbi:unnamed protein product [Linum tenue]|uniref:Uncharacterized protein n=1 Tax=Linum tenue TaxID=586396 RepID=A0AAV0P4D9_9ROSI|nr:unnamed protein product [Linum tenue]
MNPSSDDGVVDELEIVANLESECFMNLSELRYLDVQAKMLPSDFTDYLPNLRWLRWKSGNSECLPKFCVENMVILELLTPVKDDWGGLRHLVKMVSKLKVLKLVGKFLIEYPDFPRSRSLEILYLQDFGLRLSHKDLDIGNLRNLKELHLLYCEVGVIRGGTIGMVKGLQELNITNLRFERSLRAVLIGDLKFLEILRVDVITDVGLRSVYENLLLDTKLPRSLKELETTSPVANLVELVELEKLMVRYFEYGFEIPPADSSDMRWRLSKSKSLTLEETKLTTPPNTSCRRSLLNVASIVTDHPPH